jgi:hypothetical protein
MTSNEPSIAGGTTMYTRSIRRVALAALASILLVQTAIAQGTPTPDEATPFPADRPASSIDPGFVIVGGDVDPGFIASVEDRSNDVGFIAGGGPITPVQRPEPAPPASPVAPVLTLGAP